MLIAWIGTKKKLNRAENRMDVPGEILAAPALKVALS